MHNYPVVMNVTKFYSAKIVTKDSETGSKRRFRNILANSGEIMESGEVRDIKSLYVMGHDGELYRIADLNTDPEKQTEAYAVKAQADHGELIDGELVPSIEKQFGSCRVWLAEDGLRARMYFADDDTLADHAWAISEDASYSTGIDWFPDGYYGAGHDIEEPIGILREISMVLTGNDPRAQTIDTKASKGQGAADDGDKKVTKGNSMTKKLDELTPDEARAMANRLGEVLDEFTTDAPESETEPTRRDTKDGEGEATEASEAEKKAEEAVETAKSNDNVKHQPVVIVRDRAVKQEKATSAKDWRFTDAAKHAFADLAGKYRKFDSGFKAAWQAELRKHGASTNDGITGLSLPVDGRQLWINALDDGVSDSAAILGHFRNLGGKSYRIQLLESVGAATGAETARAHGHKKSDDKIFQELTATPRTIYNKMVYKMLDLDAMEVYENPELVTVRAEELVQHLVAEIARAAIIGDGRATPAEGQPDYRMFDGTRGFYSIANDATATEGFGSVLAEAITVEAGKNLYDASILAESSITADGGLVYVAKKPAITTYRQATKANGDYVVAPGARIEDSLGATAVYTPSWMEFADVDVVVFANNQYGLTGEVNATMHPDFNVLTNQDILLAEQPRGGSLIAKNAAVTLTFATE